MCDTTKQREILFKQFKGICFYCEREITFVNGTRDHFWPRGKQGWNGINNLVLSCSKCNTAKGDRFPTLVEFYKLLDIRPFLTVNDFHAPPIDPDKLSKRKLRQIQRNADRLAKRIADRAANHAKRMKERQAVAAIRRENLYLSNLAGPYYSGLETGLVRAYRGQSYPYKPLEYISIDHEN